MKRFSIAYNIEDKEINDINDFKDIDFKDCEMKITDDTGELPDLIVTDKETAREYIRYLNKGIPEEEVDSKIMRIENLIIEMNNLNEELIRPDYEIIVDEDTEDAKYSMPTEKQLFLEGYRHNIGNRTDSIFKELDSLKKLLLEY